MTQLPNRYKAACEHAAGTASDAVDRLTDTGSHPLTGALTTLQHAWVSPSREREDYQTALEDLAHRLTRAFDHATDDLTQTATREPTTVDTEDPAQAWKAWHDTRGSLHRSGVCCTDR